jgi:microcystin-dependent protein
MAEPFLGEIRMFGGDFAPRGWARCHGQLLPIADHAPLFSLIGTTYGGDGVETFALPDLREDTATSLPITFIIALAGVYPSRP